MKKAIGLVVLAVAALLVMPTVASAVTYGTTYDFTTHSYDFGTGRNVWNAPGVYTPGTDFTVVYGFWGIDTADYGTGAGTASQTLHGILSGVSTGVGTSPPSSGGLRQTGMITTTNSLPVVDGTVNVGGKWVVDGDYGALVFGYADTTNYYYVRSFRADVAGGSWCDIELHRVKAGVDAYLGGVNRGSATIGAGNNVNIDVTWTAGSITLNTSRYASDGSALWQNRSVTVTDSDPLALGGKAGFSTAVPNGVDMRALSLSVVPEPATMTLLVLGGLGILARRRKN